jgi:hypothetical protein
MDITRFITVSAIQLQDGTLVPIWDSRVSLYKHNLYGNVLKYDGDEFHYTVMAMYDLKKKTLSSGIDLHYYEPVGDRTIPIGTPVVYQVGYTNNYKVSKIKDHVHVETDKPEIKLGKKIESYYMGQFKDAPTIKGDMVYSIHMHRLHYLMEDGTTISDTYTHKLVE